MANWKKIDDFIKTIKSNPISKEDIEELKNQAKERQRRQRKIYEKRLSNGSLIVITYGPIPHPESESISEEPNAYQISWIGPTWSPWPDESSKWVFSKMETKHSKVLSWMVQKSSDAEVILKDVFLIKTSIPNLDLQA